MAVRFPGTAANRLDRTAAVPSVTAFTLMGWGYVTALATGVQAAVLGFGAPGGGFIFNEVGVFDASGVKNLRIYSGVGAVVWSGTTVLAVATWYHFAMTCAGTAAGQLLGYLNGVQEISGQNGTSQTGAVVSVGGMPDGDELNGRVAAVKMYGAVLAQPEIQQEMRSFVPVRTANLALWSPLLAVGDLADYTNTGSWTATGTLTTEDGPPVPWDLRGRLRLVQSTPLRSSPHVTSAAVHRVSAF